jgi:hypothetical protein
VSDSIAMGLTGHCFLLSAITPQLRRFCVIKAWKKLLIYWLFPGITF